MQTRVALSVLLAGAAAAGGYMLQRIRVIHVDGAYSTYWTVRSLLWTHPVPVAFKGWYGSVDRRDYGKDRLQFIRVWSFLRPFFDSHGYELYVFKDQSKTDEDLFPSTAPSLSLTTENVPHPYARCIFEDKASTAFMFHVLRVWPARDRSGRDVVIKVISGPIPTNELRALRLLQSDALRDDPQNHTIPVLEYLDFDGHVFVVMPRWDGAVCADFVKVGELVRFGQAFFEAVAFLHDHGIGHGDISLCNMAMNVIVPDDNKLAGIRGPERRYALIDFETAKLGPPNVNCDPPTVVEKTFKHDINYFAHSVEIHLRCIQDVLPALAPLFDSMKDVDSPDQPTASAALSQYTEICSSLTTDDLERKVEAVRWRNGRTTYRDRAFVYPPGFSS